MTVKKAALNGCAQSAITAAGRVEFFSQRDQAMPPINKIKLRQLVKPATASDSAQHGPGNADSDTKA